MSDAQWQSAVVPARLSFLAIYNPSLGPTDETFKDQLVFYHNRASHDARLASRKSARYDAAGGDAIREEENEQLRQIGLAQGMVDFARSFSDGQAVDSIDTERSRIVLHELEKGWWILASIDLTRLPATAPSISDSTKRTADKAEAKPSVEYSSREVSPPALLLSQIMQAHFIFTLHHGPSLTELFVKLSRDRFRGTLDRFWKRFAQSWDVLLHGNPATDIFCGLKLSCGGELGMGVGEEEWGSGERDVLEDLVRRTDGLVDLVVSRFGEPASEEDSSVSGGEAMPWLGGGNYPLASDGVVFGGINAIARPSLRNVSLWMRQIYTYGEYAYGVNDNPHRERRKRRRRNIPSFEPEPQSDVHSGVEDIPALPKASRMISAKDYATKAHEKGTIARSQSATNAAEPESMPNGHEPGIPPPIVSAAQQSLDNASLRTDSRNRQPLQQASEDDGTTLGIPDQYMKYMTFGLSTLAKTYQQKRPEAPRRTSTSSSKTITTANHRAKRRPPKNEGVGEGSEDSPSMTQLDPTPDGQTIKDKISMQKRLEEKGQFIIGLKGDIDSAPDDPDANLDDTENEQSGLRSVLRTVHIEVAPSQNEEDKTDLQRKLDDAGLPGAKDDPLNFKRLRVLIYAHRPFIYCFLFEDRTPSLALGQFYKQLHRDLGSVHKPLLSSTSVVRVMQRIESSWPLADPHASDTASIKSAKSGKASENKPIHDLIWDPAILTVHTSIPNIPEPGTLAAEGILASRKDNRLRVPDDWTRVEALNVHSQILNMLDSTQRSPHEYERASKTSRGWWVVWMKLPPSRTRDTAPSIEAQCQQEAAKEAGKEEAGSGETGFTASIEPVDSDDTAKASTSRRWLESDAASTMKQEPATNRIAFVVRKASDAPVAAKNTTATSRAASSMWQSLGLPFGSTDESTGGTSAGWGPAALAGGIGFDARKYVDGLLQLNR